MHHEADTSIQKYVSERYYHLHKPLPTSVLYKPALTWNTCPLLFMPSLFVCPHTSFCPHNNLAGLQRERQVNKVQVSKTWKRHTSSLRSGWVVGDMCVGGDTDKGVRGALGPQGQTGGPKESQDGVWLDAGRGSHFRSRGVIVGISLSTMSTMPEPYPVSAGAWRRLLKNYAGKDGRRRLFESISCKANRPLWNTDPNCRKITY